MTALRRGETREQLIKRAGMDGYAFNTSVVRATDNSLRVGVTGSAEPRWGDCVAIEFMIEGQDTWLRGYLSPARARIVAMHLLKLAAMKERNAPDRIDYATRDDAAQEDKTNG